MHCPISDGNSLLQWDTYVQEFQNCGQRSGSAGIPRTRMCYYNSLTIHIIINSLQEKYKPVLLRRIKPQFVCLTPTSDDCLIWYLFGVCLFEFSNSCWRRHCEMMKNDLQNLIVFISRIQVCANLPAEKHQSDVTAAFVTNQSMRTINHVERCRYPRHSSNIYLLKSSFFKDCLLQSFYIQFLKIFKGSLSIYLTCETQKTSIILSTCGDDRPPWSCRRMKRRKLYYVEFLKVISGPHTSTYPHRHLHKITPQVDTSSRHASPSVARKRQVCGIG